METFTGPGTHAGLTAGFKYWAFVSYSHRDEGWAAWLHRALESYRVPRALVGRKSPDGAVPRRVFPIFRDRDELPGAADLGAKIRQALTQSRYLIVICSPSSAGSRWVNEEIKTFKALGREDRVLCLIVDGEPDASERPGVEAQECFPPAIRYRVGPDGRLTSTGTEPLAADVRKGKDGKVNAKLKLLAGLLGVGYDELRQREKQRQRRRRLLQGVVLLLIVMTTAAAYLGLADDDRAIPGGPAVRTWLDRHELSVFRPVHSDLEVRRAAARMRLALTQRLLNDWRAGAWTTAINLGRRQQGKEKGDISVTDVWTSSQAACALLHAPELRPQDRPELIGLLKAPFTAPFPIKDEKTATEYGWIPHGGFTEAEPALWSVAALAAALGRPGFLTTDRTAFERHLSEAQAITRLYQNQNWKDQGQTGSWQFVPHVIIPPSKPGNHFTPASTYTTALALLALLETRAANLPWDGSERRRDELVHATAHWLVTEFDAGGPVAGWHADPNDTAKEVVDGLTLQIDSELLRADKEAGIPLESPQLRAIPRHIETLVHRGYDYPHAYGRFRYEFTDHHGEVDDELLIVEFLWYPWAITCATGWLERVQQAPVPPEDVWRVRRALGHLVVDLEEPAMEAADPKRTGAFVASELLYALDRIPPP